MKPNTNLVIIKLAYQEVFVRTYSTDTVVCIVSCILTLASRIKTAVLQQLQNAKFWLKILLLKERTMGKWSSIWLMQTYWEAWIPWPWALRRYRFSTFSNIFNHESPIRGKVLWFYSTYIKKGNKAFTIHEINSKKTNSETFYKFLPFAWLFPFRK